MKWEFALQAGQEQVSIHREISYGRQQPLLMLLNLIGTSGKSWSN